MSKNDKIINKEIFYSKAELIERGWTKRLIDECLPLPLLKTNPHYYSAPPMQLWSESTVLAAEQDERVQAAMGKTNERRSYKKEKKENERKEMRESVESLIPDNPIDEYPLARSIKRKFILHVGPTNSGKTHDSLERLKKAQSGAYLGPLRLLALEVFDRFNADGVPCSMITGEEMIETPDATITASTIEMMNTYKHYEVVVIDEVQMIADRFRGHNWTKAIIGIVADEIHLCMAPEAEEIAVALIKECGDTYEVIKHKRATELIFDPSEVSLSTVKPGDALIVFSRRAVLSLAAELEAAGIKASVIYGNLPPASRREQVRKFTEGETYVVVSTDAIGMGINLPIRRVIFMETAKYDGEQHRKLIPEEIKQIAGRAGRFGMYDKGYVLSVSDGKLIKNALAQDVEPIKKAYLGFSESLASLPYPLPEIADAWERIAPPELYSKMDLSEILELYSYLINHSNVLSFCSREEVYKMVTCPIDTKNNTVLSLWLDYCKMSRGVSKLRFPYILDTQLADLEDSYKCLDLYYQFSRRANKEIDEERVAREKEMVEEAINEILRQKKSTFQKKCRFCRKPLPFNHPHGLCENCHNGMFDDWLFS